MLQAAKAWAMERLVSRSCSFNLLIFMAVPLVAHLFAPQAIQPYFHILPPYTFFAGTIGILEHSANLPLHTGVLFLHSIIWFGIYQLFTGRKKPWSSVL